MALVTMLSPSTGRGQTDSHVVATWAGTWKLNEALSVDAQPKTKKPSALSGGKVSTSVSVGGVRLPGMGGAPASAEPRETLALLRCKVLTIEPSDSQVAFKYQDVGEETLHKGEYRGAKSRWSKKKLTSSYTSNSRRVSRSFTVDKEGRLTLTVKINPRQGSTRVYKHVFDAVL